MAWSEIVPPLWEGKISTEPFTWRLQDALRDSERHWCRDCPLGQNPCQKAEESFNGWKRASGTMHTRKCMVPLGNLHGWTSQLAWFSSPKCMVPLPALHGWTKKGSSRHCDPQHSTHICASTSPSGSVSPKIIQERSQGATPGHRTLPLPNFARCDTTTSHPATLSCRTLQHRAIAPCHFHLSHSATQTASFWR